MLLSSRRCTSLLQITDWNQLELRVRVSRNRQAAATSAVRSTIAAKNLGRR